MKLLSLALALTVACAHTVDPNLEHNVQIDPSFTADQIEAITEGIDQWSIIPALHITVTVSACDTGVVKRVCILQDTSASATPDVVGNTEYLDGDSANIRIFTRRIVETGWDVSELMRRTAAHEMGHVLAGPNHLAPGTIMAAHVADQADTVTEADVAHFWASR